MRMRDDLDRVFSGVRLLAGAREPVLGCNVNVHNEPGRQLFLPPPNNVDDHDDNHNLGRVDNFNHDHDKMRLRLSDVLRNRQRAESLHQLLDEPRQAARLQHDFDNHNVWSDLVDNYNHDDFVRSVQLQLRYNDHGSKQRMPA